MQLRQSMSKLMLHLNVVEVGKETVDDHMAMVRAVSVDKEMVGTGREVRDSFNLFSRLISCTEYCFYILQETETLAAAIAVVVIHVAERTIKFIQNLIFFVCPHKEVEGF